MCSESLGGGVGLVFLGEPYSPPGAFQQPPEARFLGLGAGSERLLVRRRCGSIGSCGNSVTQIPRFKKILIRIDYLEPLRQR